MTTISVPPPLPSMRPMQPDPPQPIDDLFAPAALLLRGRSGDELEERAGPEIDCDIWHAPLPQSCRSSSGLSDAQGQGWAEMHHHETPWWQANGRAETCMPDTGVTVVYADLVPQQRRFHCISAPILDASSMWESSNEGTLESPTFGDTASASSLADTDSHAETESTTSCELETEEVSTPPAADTFEDYLLAHCNIRAVDLKLNALARLRDLRKLFCALEHDNIVRLERAASDDQQRAASIFGFSRMHVDHIADFNERIIQMVGTDRSRCWHANGRRILKQPTNTVYELLRQLGIHPVKGTRGCDHPGARDFMIYSEYAFDPVRLKRNCSRLKIGVIGNRRT